MQQLLYCRQRGSNPHRVGVYTYVYRNRIKFRVKMVKKHQLYGYKRVNNIMVIYGYKRIM